MKENPNIKEKQILVSVVASILILAFYTLYVYKRFVSGSPEMLNDFRFWGKSFIFLIPVAIVLQIVIHIIFAIIYKIVSNEDIPTLEDERDKLIELKAIKISHWLFTIGFMLAMGSLALGMKPWVMFVTLIGSGFLSSIISELFKIFYYRRGF
jgi:hypothetical protein